PGVDRVIRVDTHRREDPTMGPGQLYDRRAGDGRGADGDDLHDAGAPRPVQDRLPISAKTGVVQVGMAVNEREVSRRGGHQPRSPGEADGSPVEEQVSSSPMGEATRPGGWVGDGSSQAQAGPWPSANQGGEPSEPSPPPGSPTGGQGPPLSATGDRLVAS